MVSKSFDIHTANLQPFERSTRNLVLEITPEMVNIILADKESGGPIAIEIFSGPHPAKDDWETIFQQSRLMSFSDLETVAFVATPDMLPIPAGLYDPEVAKHQLALFFGNQGGSKISGDVLKTADMVVAWQIPGHIFEILQSHFSFLQVKHVISSLVQMPASRNAATGYIIIYGIMAWVVLWKEGVLQVTKAIKFTHPDDLSWQLLNLCRQLSLEPEEVTWRISGAVEETSPLWRAVTRFLDPIEAADAGVVLPEELPPHYFAHLFL